MYSALKIRFHFSKCYFPTPSGVHSNWIREVYLRVCRKRHALPHTQTCCISSLCIFFLLLLLFSSPNGVFIFKDEPLTMDTLVVDQSQTWSTVVSHLFAKTAFFSCVIAEMTDETNSSLKAIFSIQTKVWLPVPPHSELLRKLLTAVFWEPQFLQEFFLPTTPWPSFCPIWLGRVLRNTPEVFTYHHCWVHSI